MALGALGLRGAPLVRGCLQQGVRLSLTLGLRGGARRNSSRAVVEGLQARLLGGLLLKGHLVDANLAEQVHALDARRLVVREQSGLHRPELLEHREPVVRRGHDKVALVTKVVRVVRQQGLAVLGFRGCDPRLVERVRRAKEDETHASVEAVLKELRLVQAGGELLGRQAAHARHVECPADIVERVHGHIGAHKDGPRLGERLEVGSELRAKLLKDRRGPVAKLADDVGLNVGRNAELKDGLLEPSHKLGALVVLLEAPEIHLASAAHPVRLAVDAQKSRVAGAHRGRVQH